MEPVIVLRKQHVRVGTIFISHRNSNSYWLKDIVFKIVAIEGRRFRYTYCNKRDPDATGTSSIAHLLGTKPICLYVGNKNKLVQSKQVLEIRRKNLWTVKSE